MTRRVKVACAAITPPGKTVERIPCAGVPGGQARNRRVGSPAAVRREPGVVAGDEVAEHLGVGLRLEGETLPGEERLHGFVVLDDSVMDEDESPVAAAVRMGVGLGHAAVGCPARMTNAGGAGEPVPGGFADQALHPAQLPGDDEPAILGNAEAGGVIAAIFEPLQSFEEDGSRFLPAGIAYNSAH